MSRGILALAAAVIAAAAAACASRASFDGDWQLLGTRQVSNLVDFEVIPVNPPRKLTEVKLLVLGSPVRIHELRVELSSGQRLEVSVASTIPAGDEGPVVTIPSGETVERVVFRHDTATLYAPPASVALYGRP